MVQVEHDPEQLLDEAFTDPGFCALVAEADAEPPAASSRRRRPPEWRRRF
ncbi:MAG: hypothetical protein AAGA54_26315 [Myxococcota bacterium]